MYTYVYYVCVSICVAAQRCVSNWMMYAFQCSILHTLMSLQIGIDTSADLALFYGDGFPQPCAETLEQPLPLLRQWRSSVMEGRRTSYVGRASLYAYIRIYTYIFYIRMPILYIYFMLYIYILSIYIVVCRLVNDIYRYIQARRLRKREAGRRATRMNEHILFIEIFSERQTHGGRQGSSLQGDVDGSQRGRETHREGQWLEPLQQFSLALLATS